VHHCGIQDVKLELDEPVFIFGFHEDLSCLCKIATVHAVDAEVIGAAPLDAM
jgi:hypothetical protein